MPRAAAAKEDTCCPPITAGPLSDVEAAELATFFAALSDPVRLRLLSIVASEGEVCSCNLEGPLGKSQPTISHHTGSWPMPASSSENDATMDVVAGRTRNDRTSSGVTGGGHDPDLNVPMTVGDLHARTF